MATHQVPGYHSANQDSLAVGAWAERGSQKLFVETLTAGQVGFVIYEGSGIEHHIVMDERAFMKEYSNTGWLFHDKTPFDWAAIGKPQPVAGASSR